MTMLLERALVFLIIMICRLISTLKNRICVDAVLRTSESY